MKIGFTFLDSLFILYKLKINQECFDFGRKKYRKYLQKHIAGHLCPAYFQLFII